MKKCDINGYTPLTFKTTNCNEIAEHINKDNPGTAIVSQLIVYVPILYLTLCKQWVKKNCKTPYINSVTTYRMPEVRKKIKEKKEKIK